MLIAHNFCFSEKAKHKKGRKEKVGEPGERRFDVY